MLNHLFFELLANVARIFNHVFEAGTDARPIETQSLIESLTEVILNWVCSLIKQASKNLEPSFCLQFDKELFQIAQKRSVRAALTSARQLFNSDNHLAILSSGSLRQLSRGLNCWSIASIEGITCNRYILDSLLPLLYGTYIAFQTEVPIGD